MGVSSDRTFTYRSARSGGLLAGIMLVLVSEGIGIHLWVAKKSAGLAIALSAMTLSAIAWLVLTTLRVGLHVDEPQRLVDELAHPSPAAQNTNLQTFNQR